MYLDYATKRSKIDGDNTQETIDKAMPFFVNALINKNNLTNFLE